MTFKEWHRENINIYDDNSPVYEYMEFSWNAALEEAIDEIRVHITVDDQERMDIAINILKNLITTH